MDNRPCRFLRVCLDEGTIELRQQVVSLELAKRLKSLGVDQSSTFKWVFFDWNLQSIQFTPPTNPGLDRYAAFTVAELGEMIDLNQRYPNLGKSEVGDWFVNFTRHHYDSFENEVDARAAILVYLLEKDVIQPPPTG